MTKGTCVIEAKNLNHDNYGEGGIINGCNSNSGNASDDDDDNVEGYTGWDIDKAKMAVTLKATLAVTLTRP